MFERDLENETEGRRERLRFWLTIGLGAILTGVVAALVLLLARANDNYDRSLGWQAHSLEIISQTRSLDAALARCGRNYSPSSHSPLAKMSTAISNSYSISAFQHFSFWVDSPTRTLADWLTG